MNHLRRELAPLSPAAWAAVEEEATRTLHHYLAARRLVDFRGPLGYEHSAIVTGRVDAVDAPRPNVTALRRRTQPLMEMRAPFTIPIEELDAIDRGARDPDLEAVTAAARTLALTEDSSVFHGYPAGSVVGITEATPHDPITIGDDYHHYPDLVARAVAVLQNNAIGGPYALALGPRCYTGVIETTEMGGYPVLEHLRLIVGGPVVWAPGVDGAAVLSTRGGDYELVVGEDYAIAYVDHDAANVQLRLEITFTFQVLTADAAVALRYP